MPPSDVRRSIPSLNQRDSPNESPILSQIATPSSVMSRTPSGSPNSIPSNVLSFNPSFHLGDLPSFVPSFIPSLDLSESSFFNVV